MTEDELVAIILNATPPGPPEPSEFITNGAFADGTDWAITAGWTIAVGVATNTLVGGTRRLSQNFGALVQPLVTGNNYVATFDCVAVDQELNVFVGVGVAVNAIYGAFPVTGPISIPFTAADDATTITFSVSAGGSTGLTIDNVSLVPVP
jgi:hypothetical protein